MTIIHSLYREPGTVRVDEATCTHCGQCAKICPAEVLSLEEGRIVVHDDSAFGCIACGHCMMVCPTGSVQVRGRGLSPDDVTPMPEAERRATADSLEALLQSRRSIRFFKDQPIEPELIDRIVAMASSAPMGIPPWDIGCTIVQGRKAVDRLAGQIVEGYEGFLKMFRPWVLTLMRPIMGRAKFEQFRDFVRPLAETYVENRREGRDVLFYNAPAVMIFHHSPYADTADAMIACTYAMVAAESLGLGTTMIGGAAPIMARNKTLCRELGMPEGNTPSIALIVGHPSVRFRRTITRRFSSVVVKRD